MQKYAIDSLTGNELSVDEWLLTKHNRGNPLCKVKTCQRVMAIVGERSVNRATHFRHPAHTDCPSVLVNATAYAQLQGVLVDIGYAKTIKRLFLENLHRVFQKCKYLIPNLSFKEFYEIVEFANNLNIWGYVDINIEYIPYVLCTCRDVFQKNPPYREYPFHFVFANVQRVDELWINASHNTNIIYRVHRDTQDVDIIDIKLDLFNYENSSKLTRYYYESISNMLRQ